MKKNCAICTWSDAYDSAGAFYTIIDCSDTLNYVYRSKREQEEINHYFRIAPNPSTGLFNILNNDKLPYSYYVYDITNKIIKIKESINDTNEIMDISTLCNGIYFIRIVAPTGTEVFKISKQ